MKTINKKYNFKKGKSTFTISEVSIITLSVAILFSSLTGFLVYKQFSGKKEANDILTTYNKIVKEYVNDVDQKKLSESAIRGMMDYLNEKYSVYMSDEESEALNEKLSGEYQGIGVQIGLLEDKVIVATVFEDSPAEKAGILVGDEIITVEGKKVKDKSLSEIVDMIKGLKKVTFTIKRENKKFETIVNIESVDLPTVRYDIFKKEDKKVGYIYLESFSNTAYRQFRKALNKIEKEGIDSLIIDVRSNTGGYLTSVTDILNIFLRKGKVLYSLQGKGNREVYKADTKEYREYPIVVLMDSRTASASEVLASTLKESYGAILVGTKSFGKGRVQQLDTLSTDNLVKYTTSKWFTPSGNSVDEKGIVPGIYVELTKNYAKNPSDETDDQLQKALEIIVKY